MKRAWGDFPINLVAIESDRSRRARSVTGRMSNAAVFFWLVIFCAIVLACVGLRWR